MPGYGNRSKAGGASVQGAAARLAEKTRAERASLIAAERAWRKQRGVDIEAEAERFRANPENAHRMLKITLPWASRQQYAQETGTEVNRIARTLKVQEQRYREVQRGQMTLWGLS